MKSFQNILFKGMIWKLLFYISAFSLNLVVANKLGAEQSGIFFFLLTNLSIASLLLNFGIESAINYFNAKKEFSSQYLLSFCITWCFAVLLLLVIGLSIMDLLGLGLGSDSVFIAFYILGSLLSGFLSALLFSSNDSITPNLFPSVVNIFLIAYLLTVFSRADTDSISLFKQIYLTSSIVTGLWFLFHLIRNNSSLSLRLTNPLSKRIIVYSTQVFFTNLFVNLLFKVDVWMVSYFCTNHDLGNYLQATKFSQFVYLLPNLASFTLFPLITKSVTANDKIETKLLSLVNLYLYISLLICCTILICGYWLFPLLYGSSFDRMYWIFIFLVPGLLAMASSYPLTPYFSSIDRNKVTMSTAFYAIIVLLVLDLLLIPLYSVLGAALAASFAYTFYFIVLLYKFKRFWNFSYLSIFMPGSLYRTVRVFISSSN